jgi:hypothetical protein
MSTDVAIYLGIVKSDPGDGVFPTYRYFHR